MSNATRGTVQVTADGYDEGRKAFRFFVQVDGKKGEAVDDCRLIEAAFAASTQCEAMEYNGVDAIKALPEMLKTIRVLRIMLEMHEVLPAYAKPVNERITI